MSYKKLIHSNVGLAWNLLKDLAEPVVLVQSRDNFDFANMENNVTAQAFEVKAVVVDGRAEKRQGNDNVKRVTKDVFFKAPDAPDVALYDAVEIGGNRWKIVKVAILTEYVYLLKVEK